MSWQLGLWLQSRYWLVVGWPLGRALGTEGRLFVATGLLEWATFWAPWGLQTNFSLPNGQPSLQSLLGLRVAPDIGCTLPRKAPLFKPTTFPTFELLQAERLQPPLQPFASSL